MALPINSRLTECKIWAWQRLNWGKAKDGSADLDNSAPEMKNLVNKCMSKIGVPNWSIGFATFAGGESDRKTRLIGLGAELGFPKLIYNNSSHTTTVGAKLLLGTIEEYTPCSGFLPSTVLRAAGYKTEEELKNKWLPASLTFSQMLVQGRGASITFESSGSLYLLDQPGGFVDAALDFQLRFENPGSLPSSPPSWRMFAKFGAFGGGDFYPSELFGGMYIGGGLTFE